MASLAEALDSAELADLRFVFTCARPPLLTARTPLLLRPWLVRCGCDLLPPEDFDLLFAPPLPPSPAAVRRYQRPSPPFVVRPAASFVTADGLGWHLALYLCGDGIARLDPLAAVLQGLAGEHPELRRAGGRLSRIEARDAAGGVSVLWSGTGTPCCAPPPRLLPRWIFEQADAAPTALEIVTPARLVSGGKPLFAPPLRKLLPFVARRVGSMLHAWCAVELDGIAELLRHGEDLVATERLRWEDWKGSGAGENYGGVLGRIDFVAPPSDDLLTLLRLATLFNVGKGAAYGAGALRLIAGGA